jgi:hypothetical protein
MPPEFFRILEHFFIAQLLYTGMKLNSLPFTLRWFAVTVYDSEIKQPIFILREGFPS